MYYGGHNWRTRKVHEVSTKLKMYPLHYCMITVRACGSAWWWVSVVWVGPAATKVVELKTDALHWVYCVGACASWARLPGWGWVAVLGANCYCVGLENGVTTCNVLGKLKRGTSSSHWHIPSPTHFTVQSTWHETAGSDIVHYCYTIWMEQSMLMACKQVGGEWVSMCV